MVNLGSVGGTGAFATCGNGNICRSADVPNCVESACAGDPLLGSPEAKCVESLHESHMGARYVKFWHCDVLLACLTLMNSLLC